MKQRNWVDIIGLLVGFVIVAGIAFVWLILRFSPGESPSFPETAEALAIVKDEVATEEQILFALIVLSEQEAITDLSLVPRLNEILLHADHPDNRAYSAIVLSKIGHPAQEAIPSLLEALSDPNTSVQKQAAQALEQIVHEESDASIIPILIAQFPSLPSISRQILAEIIGQFGTKVRKYVPRLMFLLDTEEVRIVRGKLAYAIQVISENQLGDLPLDPYWKGGFKVSEEDDELNIVIEVKKWWDSTGQNIDWEQ